MKNADDMSGHRMEATANRRMFGYWIVGVGLAIGYMAMRGSGWQGSAQLHTHMEVAATLLALMVGTMALVRFYSKKNNTFLFIGSGFLGTAMLDGYHAVVTSAFFAQYLPSDLGSLIPWSWVASRLFLSALLCLSWLAWLREQRLGEAGRISEHTVYCATGALTLASFLFFAFVPLPLAYFPEIVFHRPEELVPALFFLLALVGYLRKGNWRSDAFEHWLVLALIVGFISQAVFMSYSGRLFDMEFDAAHLLKKASYICVLTGLLINMHSIFRNSEAREAQLRETSGVLGTTIENFPAGLSVFDANLELVAFNQAFPKLLEFPQDLIKVGSSYADIIRYNAERGEYGEGDLTQLVQARVDLARQFQPHCFERTRPDGTVIEIQGVPMPGGGFLTTYTDITERRQAEAEVERSEQKLRAIFESVADGIITIDAAGLVQSLNPAAERLFGHGARDVVGRNVSMLMPEEFARDHDGHMNRYRESGGVSSAVGANRDLLGLRKDGSTFAMDLTITPATIDGQRVVTGILRDITERRKQEEALRKKTENLALIQSVASGANEIDNTNEFIQSCVKSICRHSGWPVGHAYRMESDGDGVLRPTKFWHLEDPTRFNAFRRITEQTSFEPGVGLPGRVAAGGKPAWIKDVTSDANFPRAQHLPEIGIKGAFAFPVLVHNKCVMVLEFFSPDAAKPLDGELLAVIDNASEQISRRIERDRASNNLRIAKTEAEQAEVLALSAAAEAAAASLAKSEFLANMSHELRTPLNALLGFAEMIEQEAFGPLGHEQYAEYVAIIGSSGRHLLTVINDILDYSKIEAGKLELDPRAFELSEVADNAVELLASSAHEKAIELACYVAPDVPINLIGDTPRLRQILLNLAGNAIKFTEEGGVKIEVSLAAVSGDEVLLRFEISDTGIGVGEEERAKLFDKFSQADASMTRKYGGTGLGLAISKQLVELMNGEIGVDSQLGQGSTFWFTVALAKQAKAGKGTLAKVAEAMRGRRALVVDDNPINRQVCEKYLAMLGSRVTTVADARAAEAALAEAANETPFELAIIDHMMPDMDGEELGRRIRAVAGYGDLKMVLSSSSGLVLSHNSARELGFEAALPKPLHRTVVLDCLGYLYDVALPRADAEAPESLMTASKRGSLRILVAEDNKVNQLLLDTMLRGAGHRVDVANNGREAVEAVQRQAYDLVLMDVHMPELNGLEATRRIRQLPGKAADVPILAVTAAATKEDREKCHQAGMNDYISKPIDQRQLSEQIAFWTGTDISSPAGTLDEDDGADEHELGEDAAAALENLLDTLDDVANEPADRTPKRA